MKTLIALVILTFSFNVFAEYEMKKVCHDKEVNGKMTKVCKDVKVHKKLEGTKVPEKKK
jgi:hypothetical protein